MHVVINCIALNVTDVREAKASWLVTCTLLACILSYHQLMELLPVVADALTM